MALGKNLAYESDDDNEVIYDEKNSELLEAVKNNDISKVQELLKNGANINCKANDNFGYAPLHEATSLGLKDMVIFLLNNGAEINSQTTSGKYTSLHLAMVANNKEIAITLLKAGADTKIKDHAYYTPCDYIFYKTIEEEINSFNKVTAKVIDSKVPETSQIISQNNGSNNTTNIYIKEVKVTIENNENIKTAETKWKIFSIFKVAITTVSLALFYIGIKYISPEKIWKEAYSNNIIPIFNNSNEICQRLINAPINRIKNYFQIK
ncbi:MAG: ankyrin repeat domain-containing protein [Sphingobacteriia bacterium]|nr:ankyrin repeat domain-containing protein [Sphingobacteriia bacterium]